MGGLYRGPGGAGGGEGSNYVASGGFLGWNKVYFAWLASSSIHNKIVFFSFLALNNFILAELHFLY